MTKRLTRYSSINAALVDKNLVLQAGYSSIILKNGSVYTGRILNFNMDEVIFENMRLKEQKVSANEFKELIIDFKEE